MIKIIASQVQAHSGSTMMLGVFMLISAAAVMFAVIAHEVGWSEAARTMFLSIIVSVLIIGGAMLVAL